MGISRAKRLLIVAAAPWAMCLLCPMTRRRVEPVSRASPLPSRCGNGRAAEAIFAGEDKVCTGASFDMQQADGIARNIVCNASAGEQVRGRFINFDKSSELKKQEIGRLIDHEVVVAYRKALELLTEELELNQLLIDGMMEFKTLDYDEIDLFLTSRSMKKLRKQRDEAEKRRKSSTGGMSTLLGNILSKDDDKKGPN